MSESVVPTICLVNRSSVELGFTMEQLASALSDYVNGLLAPVWGCPCQIVVADEVAPGQWGCILLDSTDHADALAYHTLTADGMPQSLCFMLTAKQDGDSLSATISHEVAEMLVDPSLNLCYEGTHAGVFYAGEVCDPCQDATFDVNGLLVSDFVLPTWFEDFHKTGTVRLNYTGTLEKPFQLTSGGYVSVYQGHKWGQAFGSHSAYQRFMKSKSRNRYSRAYRRWARGRHENHGIIVPN